MSNIVNRIKLPQNLKDAVTNLTEVAKSIPEKVENIIMELENLDEVFTNSV